MTLGACATADQPVNFTDITANRFKFVSLLNPDTIIPNNTTNVNNEIAKIGEQNLAQDGTTPPVNTVLIKDPNLTNKNLWIDAVDASSSLLADADLTSETTDFLNYIDKKYLNIYKKPARIDMDETSERTATRQELIDSLSENQMRLFEYSSQIRKDSLIVSLCQLCHSSTELAHHIWIQLFIKMFNC